MSNQAMYREGALCPWGKILDTKKVANGIYFISTAGHGGYLLSRERFNQMPEHLRNLSFTSNQYFEEDVSWCAVPLSFPEEFCKEPLQPQKTATTYGFTTIIFHRVNKLTRQEEPTNEQHQDDDPDSGQWNREP